MAASAAARPATRILLFDVDGTLTDPRKKMTDEVRQFFAEVRKASVVGIVGGSDLAKQVEQVGDHVLREWDYVFSENGLVSFAQGKKIAEQSLRTFYSEAQLKAFINYCLHYIADLDIPVKRGTFVEFRAGMINVSPIGRNCSQTERDAFEAYDKVHRVREKMVAALKERFGAAMGLSFSIGGQISFDCFPAGWDKTFCLQFLERDGFKEIHFFGDKTLPGGNDYEIFTDKRVVGHCVASPADTMRQVREVLGWK